MKSLLEPQKQKQINFLKELSYEEINDMLREYKVKLKNLKAENERVKKENYELKQAAKKVEEAWINWDEDGSRKMQEAVDELEQHLH